MKTTFRNIAFTALLTLGAFSAMTYTSCNKDECEDVVCQNGGSCSGGNCTCAPGYEGATCGTKVNAKYVGTYTATESCSGSAASYQVTITADPTDPSKVLINNLGNYNCTTGGTITFNGSANSTTLSINDAQCTVQMNATLTYNSLNSTTTLSGNYTAQYTPVGGVLTTDNCTVTLVR